MSGAEKPLPPLARAVLHHLPDLEQALRERMCLHVQITRSYRMTEQGPVVTLVYTCDPESDHLLRDEQRVRVEIRDHFMDRRFIVLEGYDRTIKLLGYYGVAIPEPAADDRRAA